MTITETRSKTTEENIRKVENQLHEHMTSTNQKFEDLSSKLDLLVEKLLPSHDGILVSGPGERLQLDSSRTRNRYGDQSESFMSRSNWSHRFKFSYFYGVGTDPCSWLRRCERYFQYNRVLDPQQKLEVAGLYLVGKAEAWFFPIKSAGEQSLGRIFVKKSAKHL